MSKTNHTGLNDRESHGLVAPAHQVGERGALVSPDDGLNQFLPVTAPGDQEHETSGPDQVTEQEHPSPDSEVVAAERVVTVDQLRGIKPQVVAEPAHQIGAGFVELSHVALPDGEVLPVPVEGQPAHGVQGPEDSQIEGVPGTDVTGTTTAGAVAGEGVAEVLLIGHQLGTTGIQGTLDKDQGGGVQTQSDGVVHQEVARADLQEQIVTTFVDGVHPTTHVGGAGVASGATGVGEEHVEAIHSLTRGGLHELCEDWLNQDLLLGGTEGDHHIVVDVEAEGMETEEQGDPAQVADDCFFVLEHPSKNVVLVRLRVVVTDEKDRTVSEGTAHQEDGDVLVVRIEGSLSRVVLGDERVGRHRIHVLRHQTGHNSQGSQCKTKLEVKGVVNGVVKTLVASSKVTRGAVGRVMGFEDLTDGVTDTEVGPVHVTSNHEQTANRQVVMGNVSQPKGLTLGMETTQEGEDRGTSAF